MSSDRVKILSELYRFVSGLVWRELSRLGQEKTPGSCDQATIDEQNERDFHLFETAIPSVSGVYDQLGEAAQEQISGNKQGLREDLGIRPLARIETRLANQLKRFGSRIPRHIQNEASFDPDQGRDADDVEDRVRRHTEFVARTGTLDPKFQQSLIPSAHDLREEVTTMAELNEMVEMSRTGGLRPAERGESDTPTRTATEDKDTKSPSVTVRSPGSKILLPRGARRLASAYRMEHPT